MAANLAHPSVLCSFSFSKCVLFPEKASYQFYCLCGALVNYAPPNIKGPLLGTGRQMYSLSVAQATYAKLDAIAKLLEQRLDFCRLGRVEVAFAVGRLARLAGALSEKGSIAG